MNTRSKCVWSKFRTTSGAYITEFGTIIFCLIRYLNLYNGYRQDIIYIPKFNINNENERNRKKTENLDKMDMDFTYLSWATKAAFNHIYSTSICFAIHWKRKQNIYFIIIIYQIEKIRSHRAPNRRKEQSIRERCTKLAAEHFYYFLITLFIYFILMLKSFFLSLVTLSISIIV